VLVDLPCTSKLNVESRVIKPLAVGLLDWKLLSPACVTIHCIPGRLTIKRSSEILKAIHKRYPYDCFVDVLVLSYKPFLSHFLPAYYPSQKVLECLWPSVHFMFKPINQLERLKSMTEAIVNARVALGCVPSNSYASLVLSRLSTNSYS